MSKYDVIRPYYDEEVAPALAQIVQHPMMKALMSFTFPDATEEQWQAKLKEIQSIRDFQTKIVYYSIQNILAKSSDGLSTSGFDQLDPNLNYLFISNHRDIILDTSLLNVALFEQGKRMTASAIGDNLVQKTFLLHLSKLNRNFLVQRNLPPRELLYSSKLMSEYMADLLLGNKSSVWIAQREGRTKDGNDQTQQGVLKMIGMGAPDGELMDYFRRIRIVPVSISYEYDPTDALKMPRILAEANNEKYIKEKNEDFQTILGGLMGTKKRIHIHVGKVLDKEIDDIVVQHTSTNKQIQALAAVLDEHIIKGYRLWPTNYIAYDMLYNKQRFTYQYTEEQKQLFIRRAERRIDLNNEVARHGFLAMYANPVVNALSYGCEI